MLERWTASVASPWLLVPGQKRPEPGKAFPDVEWQEIRLQGQEALTERASKKLKNEELLIAHMAGTRLHLEITQIPLWRAPGNHVGVKQLVDDFAKYVYLPRVKNAQVILDAIQDGVARLTWKQDTFAYADSYDAAAGRHRGLEAGRRPIVQLNSDSIVVKPEVAYPLSTLRRIPCDIQSRLEAERIANPFA